MNQDLLKIKKYYGEKMAHLCRELFPTLLETEGLLYNLIDKNFAHSRFLYDDIIKHKLEDEFQYFICSQLNSNKKDIIVDKTAEELLSDAGYNLYECKTKEDVEQFKKHYQTDEELCTFGDIEGRLETNHLFFAVKKNIDEIKRKNFDNPKRQDEYGTSVLSIQFTKGESNSLSIKNRYNHTVNNPDSTFSNNLDNIIPGLHNSFERDYDLNINRYSQTDFEIDNYVPANDGKLYKYNYEINNIYYCPDNIIINNYEVTTDYQAKERYIVFDYFILDMKNKEIKLVDERIEDSFPDTLKNIEKIEIKKAGEYKHICIKIEDNVAIITLDKQNRIISYRNNFIETIGDNFLKHNETLKTIYLDNVEKIGNDFLIYNKKLKEMYIPSVLSIGNNCLLSNEKLEEISLESVKQIGVYFCAWNEQIRKIYMPNVQYIGDKFLEQNKELRYIELPNVIKIGYNFIYANTIINSIYMPRLERVSYSFLYANNSATYICFPNLKSFGNFFMRLNRRVIVIELPNLEVFGQYYLEHAKLVDTVIVPEDIRNSFIYSNKAFANNFRINNKDRNKVKTRQYCYS